MENGRLPYNTYVRVTDKTMKSSAGGIARARRQCGGSLVDTKYIYSVNLDNYYEEYLKVGFYRIINNLDAYGKKKQALLLSAFLPEAFEEPKLREIIGLFDRLCQENGMALIPGDLRVTGRVTEPLISITGISDTGSKEACKPKKDEGLIIAGSICASGMKLLLSLQEQRLSERFSKGFLNSAKEKANDLLIGRVCDVLKDLQCYYLPLSEGGVLAGLWDFKESTNVGFDIDIREIPVCQEFVEISEYLFVNPYRLSSDGSVLICTPDYENALEILAKAEIPAGIVGFTKSGAAGNIKKDDEISCVSRPEMDEIINFL